MVEWSLAADVMMLRRGGTSEAFPPGFRMIDWIIAPGPRPGIDDLRYHLTTLFPEVRLRRGVLELRAIDALPSRLVAPPLVLVVGALYDQSSLDAISGVLEPFSSCIHDQPPDASGWGTNESARPRNESGRWRSTGPGAVHQSHAPTTSSRALAAALGELRSLLERHGETATLNLIVGDGSSSLPRGTAWAVRPTRSTGSATSRQPRWRQSHTMPGPAGSPFLKTT